jgi:RimJ/RimL family protein N-acetyltransferase
MIKTRKKAANAPFDIRLTGRRIVLRQPRQSDALRLQQLLRSREVTRYTFIPHPYRRQDATEYIRKARLTTRKGLEYHFSLETRADGTLIGGIGITHVDRANRNAEFGYWLAKPFWGQGLMTEAVNVLLAFAFGRLRLKRMYGHIWEPNVRSHRVVKRCGLSLEAVLRKSERRQGKYLDKYVYAILREEYYNQRRGAESGKRAMRRPRLRKRQ